MLCKNLYFLALLFIVGNVFSQSNTNLEDITKLSIIAPGVAYEKRIGHLQTVQAEIFMSSAWGIGYSSSQGNTSFFYASPAVGLQYRYYYNAIRREEKGKRTAMNSMNYIAPVYTMEYSAWGISDKYQSEYKRRPIHTLVLAWGMQRNYAKRFSLDCNGGLGLMVANSSIPDQNYQVVDKRIASVFAYNIEIRLGLWLGR